MHKQEYSHLNNVIKKYIYLLIASILFGILCYFTLLSLHLVNSWDGLWEMGNSQHFAGNWERSLGRWFIPYIDKLRFGLENVTLNGIITISLFSLSNIILLDALSVENKWNKYLFSFLVISSPVLSVTLSYCFTSVAYGVAYLFSVLAVWSVIKIHHPAKAIIAGALFLAFSMGCYQAYLGVTCLCLDIFLLKTSFIDKEMKSFFRTIIKTIVAIVVGGLIYMLILTVSNKIYNVTLSSYRGADEVSIGKMIAKLNLSIPNTFMTFYDFFFRGFRTYDFFGIKKTSIIIFSITLICVLFKIIKCFLDKKIINGILALCFVFVIPILSNSIMILVPDTGTSLLMSAGMALVIPTVLSIIIYFFDFTESKINIIVTVLAIILLWQQVSTITNDQTALKEGRAATVSIAEEILIDLDDDDYLTSEYTIEIIGSPSDNKLFRKSEVYSRAESYAKFGTWFTDASCNTDSWNGVFAEYLGRQLNFAPDEVVDGIVKTEKFQNMPCFPSKGYIDIINDVIVVKVSTEQW